MKISIINSEVIRDITEILNTSKGKPGMTDGDVLDEIYCYVQDYIDKHPYPKINL